MQNVLALSSTADSRLTGQRMEDPKPTESVFFLGDEIQPEEDIETAETGVTRESFEQAFRTFLLGVLNPDDAAQDIRLTQERSDAIFKIADSYLRELAGTPDENEKRKRIADYGKSEKLMKEIELGINQLRKFSETFLTTGRSNRSAVAAHIITQLDSLRKQLDLDFYDIRHSIALRKRRVRDYSRKNLTDDYVKHLDVFIGNEFSSLDTKNREILIAAALAAARVLTQEELSSPVDTLKRIPMKVSRAKKHHREAFEEGQVDIEGIDPAGRTFPVLRAGKKKQKSAPGERKSG